MTEPGVKLIGPSGMHYSELHKAVKTGRDVAQVGPVVLVDKYEDGKIYVITLNRPQRMNALGGGLSQGLYQAWCEFRDDRKARVAILTGRGDRAFCAGADLIEIAERRKAEAASQQHLNASPYGPSNPLSERLGLWKPTICALNGFAMAGGFVQAMQCDIRIAAEHGKFGISEARWNMGGWGLGALTRQIGLGIALELVLWGDTQFTAQRCYEVGWINKVVPCEMLMDTAMEYAQRALDMAPRAVRNFKELIYRGYYMTPEVSKSYGEALEQNLAGMQDSIEGVTAFAEKRRPNFTDS